MLQDDRRNVTNDSMTHCHMNKIDRKCYCVSERRESASNSVSPSWLTMFSRQDWCALTICGNLESVTFKLFPAKQ